MLPTHRFWRETVLLLDVMWPRSNQWELALLRKKLQLYNNVGCYMLLRVVGSCCSKTNSLSQQLPTFLLFKGSPNVAQQWWIRLHSSPSNIFGATHAHCTWSPWRQQRNYFVWYSNQPTLGQHCWEIRLHITAKTDETTSNIVGSIMLEVVASVCN